MPRFFILEKEMVILNPIFCTDQSNNESRKKNYKQQQILLLLHYSGEGSQVERKALWDTVTTAVCKCSRSWGILHTSSMLF